MSPHYNARTALLHETRVRVAEFDPAAATLALDVAQPGPAGSVSLDLGAAVVSFDVAVPGQVTEVVFVGVSSPSDLTRHPEILDAVCPGVLVEDLLEVLAAGRPRRVPLDAARGLGVADDLLPLGWWRVAMSVEAERRLGLLEPERILQSVESSLLIRSVGLQALLPQVVRDLNEGVADLLGYSLGELDLLNELTLGGVGSVVRAITTADAQGYFARRLDLLGRLVVDPTNDSSSRSVVTNDLVASRDSWREAFLLGEASNSPLEACDSANFLVAGPAMQITRPGGDEVEITLPGLGERATGWWVRCFPVDRHVPIAMAPLELAPSGDGTAILLIPSSVLPSARWDVTSNPTARLSSPPVSAFRRAISAGAIASRLERLGDPDGARLFWLDAVAHFRPAGDAQREHLARERSTGAASGGRGSGALRVRAVPALAVDAAGGVPAHPSPTTFTDKQVRVEMSMPGYPASPLSAK